mmetsp:Transcript_104826/g.313161  ORF Transcript_104826/g.313161 Transcript_104826/m.313161 type:complete len:229 (-) Transcript_104826:559-1245(-)
MCGPSPWTVAPLTEADGPSATFAGEASPGASSLLGCLEMPASSTSSCANSSGRKSPSAPACLTYMLCNFEPLRASPSFSMHLWRSSRLTIPSPSVSMASKAEPINKDGTSQILAMRSSFFFEVGPGMPMWKTACGCVGRPSPGCTVSWEIFWRVRCSHRTSFRASKLNWVAIATSRPDRSTCDTFSRRRASVAASSQPSPGCPSGWPASTTRSMPLALSESTSACRRA